MILTPKALAILLILELLLATDEGAFVDIGVKQDGLIHRSKLRGRQLSVGQVIEVEVLEVDEKRGRISLGIAR